MEIATADADEGRLISTRLRHASQRESQVELADTPRPAADREGAFRSLDSPKNTMKKATDPIRANRLRCENLERLITSYS